MSTTSELRKGWFRYALTQCRDNSTVAMTDDEITAEWGLVRADRLSELERDNAALREALQGLHDDTVEYVTLNKLHNADGSPAINNHWMRRARAALAGSGEK